MLPTLSSPASMLGGRYVMPSGRMHSRRRTLPAKHPSPQENVVLVSVIEHDAGQVAPSERIGADFFDGRGNDERTQRQAGLKADLG